MIKLRGGDWPAAIASVVFDEALAVLRDQNAGFEVDTFGPATAGLIWLLLQALQDHRFQA